MISRIVISIKGEDSRGKTLLSSFKSLNISGKLNKVEILDSYLLDSEFSFEKIQKIAESLTNLTLESFSINSLPEKKYDHVIEIGFLPGVTDNVGHTAKETILDLLNLSKEENITIYTSKIFLISGKLAKQDLEKIALSLHNPLIEKAYITKEKSLLNHVPEVVLHPRKNLITVSLDVPDEDLIRIGREGVQDETGRRGPLALDLESMKAIQAYFKKEERNPTDIELESLAQTWSEHCKHTIFASQIDEIKDGLYKTYIKGATNLIRKRKGKDDFCISVFSDNSGGVVFNKDYMITHKVETHNSPSALDPFGGAITGIVGVNRDTIGFGLGAKPVANTYGFCFGNPEDTRVLYKDKNLKQKMLSPKRIMDGVIKGINVGGNTSGIPTVSGFLKYDDRYRGKPLVFAGTIGLMPRKIGNKLSHEKCAQPGDYIVVVGGRVGADGIHGATFSSVVMDSNSPATAVQIGDPITQKKLSDAIIKEARTMDLYNSITDNGAGGISCSVAEMAKECGGAIVDLEKVPLKYLGLRPWEIWISESQERMTLAVPKKKWEVFYRLMESRGVEATAIGEFTDSGNCIVNYDGKKIMDLPLEFLHNGLPKKVLHTEEVAEEIPDIKISKNINLTKNLLDLLKDKNISGFSFISEQYDHEVQGSSVLKPLSGRGMINTDAQVIRPLLGSQKGAVLSCATYPQYSDLNSYDMALCAVDTAVRNIVASGGTLSHLSLLDNFCWCSSDDSKRLYQLKEAGRACYDGAVAYGTPYISGKDSMWNDFKGYDEKGNSLKISIPPTLLISGISVIADIDKVVSPEFKNHGDLIYIIGETKNEIGAPKVDLKQNLKNYHALEKVIHAELVASSISITSGGLGVALAKASIGGMLGCKVSFESSLFSESQGRILVSVSPKDVKKFEKVMKSVICKKIGKVSKDGKFSIDGSKDAIIKTDVKNLHTAYHSFSNRMK